MGLPPNGWFLRENPTKMDDEQGYPYFRKPPYPMISQFLHLWNHHSQWCFPVSFSGKSFTLWSDDQHLEGLRCFQVSTGHKTQPKQKMQNWKWIRSEGPKKNEHSKWIKDIKQWDNEKTYSFELSQKPAGNLQSWIRLYHHLFYYFIRAIPSTPPQDNACVRLKIGAYPTCNLRGEWFSNPWERGMWLFLQIGHKHIHIYIYI